MIKVIHPKFEVTIILKERKIFKFCKNVNEVKKFVSKCKKDLDVLYVRCK